MVRIGTAGWSIPRVVAERFAGEGTHLERYGRVMDCAEINSTFYRPPRVSTWAKWAASVPAGFRFAVKAPKTLTHEAQLDCSSAMIADFIDAAALLGEKLGPLLFQLPPKLAFERSRAEAFLGQLREGFGGAVVLEPRHASWFSGEVSELLAKYRVGRVAADPARVAEAAEPGGLRGLIYYRLHGSPRTYYTAYTTEYLDRLAEMIATHPSDSEIWVVFDNTASGAALHNALELKDKLLLNAL